MDRPRVVVGFCRDWVKYADWLEGELDTAMKVSINDQKMLEDAWEKNTKLREGYAECVIDLQDWATYAPEYFKEKHGLDECVAEHKAALEVGDEHV
jgi:hypothetical protein